MAAASSSISYYDLARPAEASVRDVGGEDRQEEEEEEEEKKKKGKLTKSLSTSSKPGYRNRMPTRFVEQ